MNQYVAHSDSNHPFIRDIDHHILAQGGIRSFVSHGPLDSHVSQLKFKTEYGIPVHDTETNLWQQREPAGEKEITIIASSDQRIQINSELGLNLVTTLRAGNEMPELLNFLMHSKADKIDSSTTVQRKINSLVEDVFLLVGERKSQNFTILPFHGDIIGKRYLWIMKMADVWLHGDWSDMEAISKSSDSNPVESHTQEGGPHGAVSSRDGDLVFCCSGTYAGPYLEPIPEADSALSSPNLVIRLKKNVSRMWFSDFLEYAIEAQDLIKNCFLNWESMPQSFMELLIDIPRLKRDQIAHSVELRRARLSYRDSVEGLSFMREPFQGITRLYRKRAKAVEAVHGESLEDIEAIQRPLPFILEYPYRHFRREDDPLQKSRAGQRLLGVLIKVPLFLVIEELLAIGHRLGSMILDAIEERPNSDGALLELQQLVAKELATLPASPLVIFDTLQILLNDTQNLNAMVTARNRMHHEPYDEVGFIRVMEELAPSVVTSLREALKKCHFVVPHHGRVLGGDKLIKAEDTCSADSHFKMIDLKVTLPLEHFPSGELIVWKSSPEQTLKLGSLLTSKLVTQQSRDFGIFDRMNKKERYFTYLRSD